MVEDETQAIQRNVEKDLFDEQSKILDRFYSLIILTFTAFGFAVTTLTFIFGRGAPHIQDSLRSYHINFSFFCMLMTFLISVFNVLALSRQKRLVNKSGMIGYREDNELLNNNLKLYISNTKQKNYYVTAIAFIGLALTSFFNSFAQHPVLTAIVIIGSVVAVAFLVRNLRRR